MSHYIILALRRCRSGHLRCAHQHLIAAEASWTHALLVLLQGRSFTFLSDHLIFGLSSSCERVEFMFALVMRLTPVSILAGTCSPFEAASAVLTPSYPMRNGSCTTSAAIVPSCRNLTS